MKKLNGSLIVFIIALFISCNTDNPVQSTDQLLEKNILGKWAGNSYSITFNSDYTFSDSAINVMVIDSNHSLADTVKRIGKYIIKDGVLYLYDFNFTYVRTNATGITHVSTQYEISIFNNKLMQKSVDVFELNSVSNNEIYGSWKRDKWYCNYSLNDSLVYSNGKQEEYFTFWQDSTKCNYQIKYLTGAGSPREYSYKAEFIYQNSKLSLPGFGYANLGVQFKQNKMFWYQTAFGIELSRM